MNIYNSKQWKDDLEKVLRFNPWINELAGKTVLITGMNGLVCSTIADILLQYNETHKNPVVIVAAARSKKRIIDRFGKYVNKPYFIFIEYDATKVDIHIPFSIDYIIHGASNSSPDRISIEPVETMISNFMGLYTLLKYACENNVLRLLYISSSEVYGLREGNELYTEEHYGYIELLNSRNSYAVGKRAAETLCVSFADEFGIDSVITRPGHLYGPTASITDRHVSSQWAYAAARGEDIIMKSDGTQMRSYCYCLDAASAILTVLLRGENKHAYNVSNPNSVISIRQMAEILADNAGVQLKIEIPTGVEQKWFNPMSNSALDSTRLINLGWKGCFNAEEGFSHTVQILKEISY